MGRVPVWVVLLSVLLPVCPPLLEMEPQRDVCSVEK
jgi:hypothetical protein